MVSDWLSPGWGGVDRGEDAVGWDGGPMAYAWTAFSNPPTSPDRSVRNLREASARRAAVMTPLLLGDRIGVRGDMWRLHLDLATAAFGH